MTRKPFPWLNVETTVFRLEEPWYQRRYYKRVKYRSSFLDEDIPFFERRYNSRMYIGQIKVLNFKTWTLIIATALRTFSKAKSRSKYRVPLPSHRKKLVQPKPIPSPFQPIPDAVSSLKPNPFNLSYRF